MERDKLRNQIRLAHRQLVKDKGFFTFCAWCREDLGNQAWDLHEYLVKRGVVPHNKQHLIMVPENCVPLHHTCHMIYGQTDEMRFRCLGYAIRTLGSKRVGQWYANLWQVHGLSVPHGNSHLADVGWHLDYLSGLIGRKPEEVICTV